MQMTLDLTPPAIIELAHRMGIPEERDLPDVASIGLGSGLVTPLDMATAYSPLSNGGSRVTPLAISKVVRPNGQTDVFAPERERVFSDGVAYEVTRILQSNVTGGTGGNARISVPAAGKTGTTSDFRDAWFVGYTPEYSTAVWVGYPNANGTTPRFMTSVHGTAVNGGSFPAMIWHDFMQVVVDRLGDSGSFPLPNDNVTWSPFSSDFTRAAHDADSTESVASTKSTTTTKSTSTGTLTIAPQRPPPSTAQQPLPPPPAPPPTTAPVAPPTTVTPTTPATPPPPPVTTPPPTTPTTP
jgi:penicillin-binding protein 1A